MHHMVLFQVCQYNSEEERDMRNILIYWLPYKAS